MLIRMSDLCRLWGQSSGRRKQSGFIKIFRLKVQHVSNRNLVMRLRFRIWSSAISETGQGF